MIKGSKMSEESCKKMSNSAKGKVILQETREKISEKLKGRIPWNKGKKIHYSTFKGKKHSEETKKKISERLKKIAHAPQNSLKWKPWNLGKNHSEETKDKIREKAIGRIMPDHVREITLKALLNSRHKVVPLKGDKHPNWNGGISSLRSKIWSSIMNKKWRKSILVRDKYTCLFCYQIGGILEVDHIIPFSFIIKKFNIKNISDAEKCSALWDINNGRTLCKECHKKTDTYMRKAKLYVEN